MGKAAGGKAGGKGRGRGNGKGGSADAAPPPAAKPKQEPMGDFRVRPQHGGFRDKAVVIPEMDARSDAPAKGAGAGPVSPGAGAQGHPDALLPHVPVVDRLPFNLFVVATTFGNILVIGLEMDQGPGPGAPLFDRMLFAMLEWLFCGLFVTELGVRISVHKGAFFLELWNVLDVLLVSAACLDGFVLAPIGAPYAGNIRFLTVFRAIRAVGLVRLVRMFSEFRELWLLAGGLVNSVRALGWAGLVILITLYVCSIVATAEIGHKDELYGIGPSYDGEVWPYKEYFGTVFKSMFTLFQVMTLDGWCDDIVRHVVYRQPLMGLFFVIFLFMTAFGLMNVVVGIIVENTLAAAQISDRRVEEKEGEGRKEAVNRLHDLLIKSDAERKGEISVEEMKAAHQSKIVQDTLKKIGLTIEEVQEIFKLLDYEQRGVVEVQRFTHACHELVAGPKRRDLAQVEVVVGALAQHLEHLDRQFIHIEDDISELTALSRHFVQNTVRVLTGFDGSVKVPQVGGSVKRSSSSPSLAAEASGVPPTR